MTQEHLGNRECSNRQLLGNLEHLASLGEERPVHSSS